MSDALPTARRRRTRTFTGCLTCRRRKVKCPDSTHPCQACHRLRLECVSPFTSNLRSSNISNRSKTQFQDAQSPIDQPSEPQRNEAGLPACSDSFTEDLSHLYSSPTSSLISMVPKTLIDFEEVVPEQWNTLFQSRDELSEQSTVFNTTVADRDPAATNLFSPFTPEVPPTIFDPEVFDYAIISSPYGSGLLPAEKDPISTHDSVALCDERYDDVRNKQLGHSIYSGFLSTNLKLLSMEAELPTIGHFRMHLANNLSVKDAKWNIFAYFLDVHDQNDQSPMKSSIIACAAAHRSVKDQNASHECLKHYAYASSELARLFQSLQAENEVNEDQTHIVHHAQVEMILATVYFLSHCDVIACNVSELATRFDNLRDLVRTRWDSLSPHLSGVNARLFLWLSYLDLRCSFLLQDDVVRPPSLLDTINQRNALSDMYLRSRLYLKEAFGARYPSSELRDDMIQDPVNAKFAEAMSVLRRIIDYACKSSKYNPRRTKHSSEETCHLHLQLTELERECDIALQGFNSAGSITVTRTSYHWLNLKTINNAGLILLNRIESPHVRVDQESQRAAYEILKIVIKLREANKLHNPHSVFSVFPIFLAGIETIDEVHQDWIVRFLDAVSDWGLHVQRASKLLQRVLEMQKQTGLRLAVWEIAKLTSMPIIL